MGQMQRPAEEGLQMPQTIYLFQCVLGPSEADEQSDVGLPSEMPAKLNHITAEYHHSLDSTRIRQNPTAPAAARLASCDCQQIC